MYGIGHYKYRTPVAKLNNLEDPVIWLVKTREKAICDGAKNLYIYLKDCMEPAEKYIKHIKSKKITPDVIKDAGFHLYQLMEIYISCKIVARWLCLKTKSEQLDFFHHLTDVSYLKEVCDFSDSYCSQFEYNSFSDEMRKKITALFDESINDVKKAFRECVSNFDSQVFENGLTESDAIASMISFYINQGVWTALRIIPTRLCTYEKIIFQGQDHYNWDYITGPILSFNKNFELEPIYNNLKFYEDAAKACFIYFLTLAKKLYDSDIEIRIEKIEHAVHILREDVDQIISKSNKNNKLIYYQSLPREELIQCFYQVYEVVPKFLEILQTYKFEDKIILSKDFYIANGFQSLLISYLDTRINSDKNDIALLKVLFHIDAKNPGRIKTIYRTRLTSFKKFIDECNENS